MRMSASILALCISLLAVADVCSARRYRALDAETESALAAPRSPTVGPCWFTVFDGHFRSEKGNFTLYWTFIAGDTLMLQISLPGPGFVAIGFGSTMNHTDMVIGWVYDNKTAYINDYFALGHEKPYLDTELGGTDDIQPLCGRRTEDQTIIRFVRKLNTSDIFDAVVSDEINDLIYAWGEGNPGQLEFHGDNHNRVELSFLAQDGVPDDDMGEEESGYSARQLIVNATQGVLATIQSSAAGAPNTANFAFGAPVGIADTYPSSGQPYLLLTDLERSVINLEDGNINCSLAVQLPVPSDSDVRLQAHVTLFGTLDRVADSEIPLARSVYEKVHPLSSQWDTLSEYHFYQFLVTDVYWVGGPDAEHYLGYIFASSYLSHKL